VPKRDEFPSAIRSALALRAAYCCSICNKPTVGPSDESTEAVSNIGTAAHISAAAPGGPRYDASMSSEQRKSVDNGIWLCADHGRLIDTDVATFTVEILRRYKDVHERRCRDALANRTPSYSMLSSLIAFGPDIVCVGDLAGAEGTRPFTSA
jgi:hypothetical protein